jgi:mono/diheme cytochrome c family protein
MTFLMKQAIAATALVALSFGGGDVWAQAAGDMAAGLAVARRVCSTCHAVGRGEARSPNSRSPTFVELANTPGMTAMALTVALTTPHAGMPMFVPTADERENIIAYILSLKK